MALLGEYPFAFRRHGLLDILDDLLRYERRTMEEIMQ